jgi:hypothetical protein
MDNIKIDLKEVALGVWIGFIGLEVRGQWGCFMDTVMKFGLQKRREGMNI